MLFYEWLKKKRPMTVFGQQVYNATDFDRISNANLMRMITSDEGDNLKNQGPLNSISGDLYYPLIQKAVEDIYGGPIAKSLDQVATDPVGLMILRRYFQQGMSRQTEKIKEMIELLQRLKIMGKQKPLDGDKTRIVPFDEPKPNLHIYRGIE